MLKGPKAQKKPADVTGPLPIVANARKPFSPPFVPIKESEVPPEAIGLMKLTPRTCRWPIGNPGEAEFRFCGKLPEDSGSPYCSAHSERAFQPGTGRQRAVYLKKINPDFNKRKAK